MKRWLFLAVAALLGFSASAAQADYFIIKVNLASTKEKSQTDPDGQFVQQGGGSGLMPGAGGQPGLGFQGIPGGMAPGSGMPPGGMGMGSMPAGFGGRRGGRGMGAPGGGGMGMSMGDGGDGPGAFGGRGGAGFRGMGAGPGQQGGLGLGRSPGLGAGLGAGMGMGGKGMGDGLGGPPGGSSIMNQLLGDDDDTDSAPIFVGAIIEARHEDVKQLASGRIRIKHKWGQTTLFIDSNDKEIEIIPVNLLTVAQQYPKEKARIKGIELAKWALAHGMNNEVVKIVKEVLQADPKDPIGLAFQQTEAALAKEPQREDAGLRWRDKFGEFKEERSKHYVLCYDGKLPAQVKQRLQRLEENMRGFYYWFALRGKVLPVPDRKLVAFLVDNKETFLAQHKDIFDDVELTSDGFYDRRENIAVFSAYRLDDAYAALDKITKPLWSKFTASELLAGKKELGVADNENARAQTLTLLQKAMQDEAELNAVSYEGTRQLLDTIGYLPKGVEIPKWFDFGLASLFEIPKGAFWHGTGSQNQQFLAQFQVWNEQKKLDKAPEALMGVVTDRYFRRVADAKNKENSENRAKTLAWTLNNYLSEKKLDGLIQYCKELRELPRDLELNDEILALTFARAFGLCDPNNPDKIDPVKFTALANDWYKTTNSEVLEVMEVKALKKRKSTSGQSSMSTDKDKDAKPGDPGSFIK